MSVRKQRALQSFKRRQARIRRKQWIRAILRSRDFTGLETLKQGLEFCDDSLRLSRRSNHGLP